MSSGPIISLSDVLANRVAAEFELLGERFVYDGHLRRSLRVGRRELAARQQRDAHGAEVSSRDFVVPRLCIGVGPALESFDRDVIPPVVAGKQRNSCGGNAVTPGTAASSCSTRSYSAFERAGSYPLRPGEMPKVTTLSTFSPSSTRLTFTRLLTKRPAHESSAIDSAILGGDEPGSESRGGPRPRRLTGLCLDSGDQVRFGGVQCGKEPKDETCRQRQAGSQTA